jgi:hypothetical protein
MLRTVVSLMFRKRFANSVNAVDVGVFWVEMLASIIKRRMASSEGVVNARLNRAEEINLAPFDVSVNNEVVLFNSTNESGLGSKFLKVENCEMFSRSFLKRCCSKKESAILSKSITSNNTLNILRLCLQVSKIIPVNSFSFSRSTSKSIPLNASVPFI